MAAAIGARMPITGTSENMIVDISGGTPIAVISLAGRLWQGGPRGGNEWTKPSSSIKKTYNLLIGERTAERDQDRIGSALPPRTG